MEKIVFRPASLLEQHLGYLAVDDAPTPLAVLRASAFEHCDEWNDLPMVDKDWKKPTPETSPDDVYLPPEIALTNYAKGQLADIPPLWQECYTVLASAAESGAIYDVPAALKRMCVDTAKSHEYLGETFIWTALCRSRVYILNIRRCAGLVTLYSYNKQDVDAYKSIFRSKGPQKMGDPGLIDPYCVPFAKATDYMLGCWCEANGYERDDVVLEYERGGKRYFFVRDNPAAKPKFVVKTTAQTVSFIFEETPEVECDSYADAMDYIRNDMEHWDDENTTRADFFMFGAVMEKSNGDKFTWKISVKEEKT